MTLPRLASRLLRSRRFGYVLAGGLYVVASGALGFALAQQALRTVDQITDFSASAASGMFRFAPDLVRIAPGETVTFLNSRGSHTVKTQRGLWPEGAPKVDIAGRLRAEVPFDQPGLYGLICGRHGKYGMVMLVAVGDVDATADDLAEVDSFRVSALAKAGFRRLLSAVAE